jgi:hypothetical protein
MVEIFLKFQQSIHRSTEELWMSKSICYISVLFFGCYRHIILVSFAMIVIVSNRAVQPFLFPFQDMLERRSCVPGSVSDESVLVLKGEHLLAVDISARETKIRQ